MTTDFICRDCDPTIISENDLQCVQLVQFERILKGQLAGIFFQPTIISENDIQCVQFVQFERIVEGQLAGIFFQTDFICI
jgi:hypothetical protein